MAEKFNPSAWVNGVTIPQVSDYQNIASDLATRGVTIDGGMYGRANSAYLTLVPKDLPGTAYTVTAASWSSGSGGVVTLTIGTHNIIINQHVTVAGITPSGYNSTDAVVTAIGLTTISYALGTNPGTWSSGGTVTVDLIATPGNGTIAMGPGVMPEVWDGSFWNLLRRFRSSFTLTSGNSANITNTTATTAFSKTVTIPAGAANFVGAAIRVRVGGNYSAVSTPFLTIYMRVAGSNIVGASFTTGSGGMWTADADLIVRTTGSSGTIYPGSTNFSIGGVLTNCGTSEIYSPLTVNLTGALVIDLTATWTAASTSNIVFISGMTVDVIMPGTTF